MSTIDVGPGATNRASNYTLDGRTIVDLNNSANDNGILDTFEIYGDASTGSTISGTKIGTFYGELTSKTNRDYENIGDVTSGSTQTFTGKNCDVESGDYLGIYWSSGSGIERDTSAYAGIYIVSKDAFTGSQEIFSLTAGDAISIYATGATAAAGNPYYYYLQQ